MSLTRKVVMMLNHLKHLVFALCVVVLVASCASTAADRAYFEKTYQMALNGDTRSMETVANNYCNGNKFAGIGQDPAECEKWRILYLDAYPGSAEEKARSGDRFRGLDVVGGLGYLYRNYKEWGHTYNSKFAETLQRLRQSPHTSHMIGLVRFYMHYPELDPNGNYHVALSGQLCQDHTLDYSSDYTFCSVYGDWYYDKGDNKSLNIAYRAYKQRRFIRMEGDNLQGTNKYWPVYQSVHNLAVLSLQTINGISPQPEEAIKLFNRTYQWQYNRCVEKYSKASSQCIKIENEWKTHISEAFQIKLNMDYQADQDLPDNIRADKYKLGLTQHLKEKNYQYAVFYFQLFDEKNMPLPASMIFFKAEAYYQIQDKIQAKKYFSEYLKTVGDSGTYYRKALSRLNEM